MVCKSEQHGGKLFLNVCPIIDIFVCVFPITKICTEVNNSIQYRNESFSVNLVGHTRRKIGSAIYAHNRSQLTNNN